jgi:hypothetical protein
MALTTQLEFYRARAEQCRAEDAWLRMADRVARTEAMRREKEAT